MYPQPERRPSPPPLVIAICVYEMFAATLVLFSKLVVHMQELTHPGVRTLTLPIWLTIAGWLTPAFAIAAAITLWQLRRAGFVFLFLRLMINLLSYGYGAWYRPAHHVVSLGHPHPIRAFLVATAIARIIGVLSLILSAAICWYAYDVTKPQPVYPYPPPDSPDPAPFL